MDFYKKLTDLLKSATELQNLDLLKKVDYSEKEKLSKIFKDKLISYLEVKAISEESKRFRKYWILYLDELIDSTRQYCSKHESSKIAYLIKEENEKKENNENMYNNMNNIEDNKIKAIKKGKENNKNIDNVKLNDEYKIDLKNIDLDKIKEYHPKKYKDKLNKWPEENKNKNEIFEHKKEEKKRK